MTQRKRDLINQFFAAYAQHHEAGIRQVVAENVKWTFPGHHPLSGTYVGSDDVMAFFNTMRAVMCRSHAHVEKLFTGANYEYVAVSPDIT